MFMVGDMVEFVGTLPVLDDDKTYFGKIINIQTDGTIIMRPDPESPWPDGLEDQVIFGVPERFKPRYQS